MDAIKIAVLANPLIGKTIETVFPLVYSPYTCILEEIKNADIVVFDLSNKNIEYEPQKKYICVADGNTTEIVPPLANNVHIIPPGESIVQRIYNIVKN